MCLIQILRFPFESIEFYKLYLNYDNQVNRDILYSINHHSYVDLSELKLRSSNEKIEYSNEFTDSILVNCKFEDNIA